MTERQAKYVTMSRFVFYEYLDRVYRLQAGKLLVWNKRRKTWLPADKLLETIAMHGWQIDAEDARVHIFGRQHD